METELFMECEEEELEPWQLVDDSVEEDDDDYLYYDNYCEPVTEDSLSPLPASETPPPITPAPTVSPSEIVKPPLPAPPAPPPPPPPSVPSAPPPPVPPAPPAPPPAAPSITSSPVPRVSAPTTPAAVTPPLIRQATPLILTQTAGGTFLVPACSGAGNAPPIIFTTAQGFPVQTMMNRGASLVLNLQPGQTVQPLTLIQSPSLGQLVRPGVAVSPVLPQAVQNKPSLSGAPARPGSALTAMQLPATLTIRTSTPGTVNLQVTQVSGANTLNLAGSPALPSGSAICAPPVSSISRTGHPIISVPRTTTAIIPAAAPTSDPQRVVMSVEEFYYGTFEGDLSLRKPNPLGVQICAFTCQICSHHAENNLRLMQHMLQHSQLIGSAGALGHERDGCKFCFRQFSSPDQLKSHQDQVHGSNLSTCMCRICEWAFENEPVFLNHMKSNHKPGEMPYVCQVCSFRSSFYSDVLQHFASFHRESRFLLCVFCLKVMRNSISYQQHLLRHQVNQAFHCNRCRLQFIFLKDKMQHKLENHRSFSRPAQLEGLPSGSKVTIRTYGKVRSLMTSSGTWKLQSPSALIQPTNIKTEPLQKNLSVCEPPRSPNKRTTGHSGPNSRSCVCLECGTDVSDFSCHFPTHVRCLLCRYSSCCSRAYASHMIHRHGPRPQGKVPPLHRLAPPCVFELRCTHCDFRPRSADHMAEHLQREEEHRATCRPRVFSDPDIRFCSSEDQIPSEEPVQNQDLDHLSWRSVDSWKPPSRGGFSIDRFSQTSGPRQSSSKNSDALDFFQTLFPASLLDLITSETNAHVKTRCYLGAPVPDWNPVTVREVKGFLGLVILMGIQNLPDPAHYWSLNHYDNSYTFYRAMSFKRFKQIAANIRMGSFATEEVRGTDKPADSLHLFRPMLDLLGQAMWSAYRPNCCLTIDRALLPNPEEQNPRTKADPKTQPQVWLLCDSKSGYCHRLFIQTGRRAEPGFTVVPELVKGLEDKHHQLYLANSLTSVPLMQKLLDQGIYASSSFPPPSPVLPRALWDEGQLDKPGDFLQRQFGPLLATRWRDSKEMGCLSTNAAPGKPDTVWRRSQTKVGGLDPINRPLAFSLLQENMRGVDICKQLLACNPLGGIPQDRHWRSLFWFLVNLSIVNAFILLRESLKDKPPTWVQDGLFTQVSFRKRLGNQLAKCALNCTENQEIARSRGSRTGAPEKLRHRMGKVSSHSKRCRNCFQKNSLRGCVVCKVNLCKRPSCFWEYHGRSPKNPESTKVGFLRSRTSSGFVEEVKGVGGAMPPVEDVDLSDEERKEEQVDADQESQHVKVEKQLVTPLTPLPPQSTSETPAAILSGSKEREDFLTARQLRIALFALCDGLRQASRVFQTDTQLIRSWLQEARRRLKGPDQMVLASSRDQMVAWVLSMREQQLPITESNLFHKVSTLKKKGGFSDSFRISYVWAVGFMLQNRLGVQSVGRTAPMGRTLPPLLESKIRSFREFTQRVVLLNQLPETGVAAMDELCLFVDLRLVQDRSRRSEALELTGSLPLVTVYLSVRADGTMLPALVLTNRKLADRVLPEFVLLEACPEGLLVEEALDLWTNRVWLPHLSALSSNSKSLLVLDRHREHMADSFLASVSGSGTLPAVIPAGCSFRLQPLDVCGRPVLQRLLLSRWASFVSSNPEELEETSPQRLQATVAQLLVDWVVEALTHLNTNRQLWKTSFHLTGLLLRSEEEQTTQTLEEVQLHLLQSLTQTLLGPDASETNTPELEDEEEEEEEEEQRKPEDNGEEGKEESGQEMREEKKEVKEESGQEMREEKKEVKEESGQEMREEEKKEVKKEVEEETEDSEEEAQETQEESLRERRETRIVIGEEVGDEWKITVKSRSEDETL